MSVSSIQETILLYTQEQNNVTSKLTRIMGQIVSATRNSTEILVETNAKRAVWADRVEKNLVDPDSTTYENATNEIEQDYQLQLAEINSWESALEMQKAQYETQLKSITTYKESWQTEFKENVKKDFTYGQSGGSAT